MPCSPRRVFHSFLDAEAKNLCESIAYIQLMVKPLYTLALRALSTNKEVLAHLTRIQHGFMPEAQIEQAQRIVTQLQDMLQEMKEVAKTPPSSTHIPLK